MRSVVTEDIGADFGFGGTTYLATATLAHGDRRRVVVKLATAERTQREITFYEACAPSTPIDTPGLLGGSTEGDRGVVILEYLPVMRQGDVLAGCSPNEFLNLARTLGRLHGRWWGAEQSELDALRVTPWQPELLEGRLEAAAARHAVPRRLSTVLEGLSDRLEAAHSTLYGGPLTLTHRDFHLDNVLLDPHGEPTILDWQGAAVGPPAVDVARLFVDCRPPVITQELVDRSLDVYREALAVDGGPDTDELRQQIRLALDCSLAATINWLGREEAGTQGSRMEALEQAVLGMLTEAINHFIVD